MERDGKRYAYRLTGKGTKVALTFVLFHQRLCGPLANSLFHHQANAQAKPKSKLEAALPQGRQFHPQRYSTAGGCLRIVEVFLFTIEKVRI